MQDGVITAEEALRYSLEPAHRALVSGIGSMEHLGKTPVPPSISSRFPGKNDRAGSALRAL